MDVCLGPAIPMRAPSVVLRARRSLVMRRLAHAALDQTDFAVGTVTMPTAPVQSCNRGEAYPLRDSQCTSVARRPFPVLDTVG